MVTAQILDGRSIAQQIQSELAQQVAEWRAVPNVQPCLAAVLVGEDPASQVYVRNKRRACERAGIESKLVRLDATTSQDELLDLISTLNSDASVHGILVQLPLPDALDATAILDAIDPLKDVDAFHPENVGRLVQGRARFLPCTPHGVQNLLYRYGLHVAGKRVVIIGRSDIVGKPLAVMLMQRDSVYGPEYANGTVTVCHSRSAGLAQLAREADILVAAIGRAKFVGPDMVKPGAVVIDVGINRTDSGLVGDVDFQQVKELAGHITPVPRGVGPLTVSMLLHNTLTAAKLQNS